MSEKEEADFAQAVANRLHVPPELKKFLSLLAFGMLVFGTISGFVGHWYISEYQGGESRTDIAALKEVVKVIPQHEIRIKSLEERAAKDDAWHENYGPKIDHIDGWVGAQQEKGR